VRREAEVSSIIDRLRFEPIDVTVDTLFEVRLAKLADDEYVLIVAMEHIISDAVSVSIFLRDFLAIYLYRLHGEATSLPAIPVQFADYAIDQGDSRSAWIETHGAYWHERLKGCHRLRFPGDGGLPTASRGDWGTIPIQIGADLKAELADWCRSRRTTLVTTVFTAYVGLVLRWCNVSDTVIRYQTSGRLTSKVQNTIGYFASVLHLRLQLHETDSFIDLAERVTKEYCTAYEHADSSFLDAQEPPADFTRNTCFNWVPQEPRTVFPEPQAVDGTVVASPAHFAKPGMKNYRRDNEPLLLLYDTDTEISGGVHFPLDRISPQMMQRFSNNFLNFLKTLLVRPEQRVRDVLLS
jgi:hypothetical protein